MARDRDLSRSPPHRKRYSRSPSPVGNRHSRRSRRNRSSRSPYSHTRKRSRSVSPRRRKSRSPSLKRRKSRSPTPRRSRRQRNVSPSLSSIAKARSPSTAPMEQKITSEKLRKEEEQKRRQMEAELKLIEEETARRLEEAIQQKVKDGLSSGEIKAEVQRRFEGGRKRVCDEVAAQLEKEKEAALADASNVEDKAQKEKEELERMMEESRKKMEEAQRSEALEQQRRDEERYRELEELQRQKEEAMRRKKQEEEEQRANQTVILGKNKARPKFSFAFGLK